MRKRPIRKKRCGTERAAAWAESMRHLVPGGESMSARELEMAVMLSVGRR